jgi:hypothetical protein
MGGPQQRVCSKAMEGSSSGFARMRIVGDALWPLRRTAKRGRFSGRSNQPHLEQCARPCRGAAWWFRFEGTRDSTRRAGGRRGITRRRQEREQRQTEGQGGTFGRQINASGLVAAVVRVVVRLVIFAMPRLCRPLMPMPATVPLPAERFPMTSRSGRLTLAGLRRVPMMPAAAEHAVQERGNQGQDCGDSEKHQPADQWDGVNRPDHSRTGGTASRPDV